MGNSQNETKQSELKAVDPESNEKPSHHFDVVQDQPTRDLSADAGRKIGRYRLLHLIDEGGMGVVWHATQEHPVKRDVALKLVRSDLGKDALARFDSERQAIAMMDHPNIAKILDADTTEDGAPYFVMELVKGIPLDQYCNNRKLGIEERLQLMLPVCRAVQHAHQKAIIHRDLKHSNILVAENDDEPTPKVIDFGLAKALGSQKLLTDKTVHTEFGKVVGTINYMSPEQAASDGMDIDTRSDIFSLGVVLYKLLTGTTPIQMEGDSMSLIGAIEVIREKEPLAPSAAVRSSSDWASNNTPATSDRFSEQLKGDLDLIVQKALEKDRRRRYETASGLELDIERYLSNQPVLAQSRGTAYLIKKFFKRNKGLVASLATISVLLVGGIVATLLSLMFALSETERVKTSEKRRSVQLKAQLNKSAWSNLRLNNVQTAWQSLRQMQRIDPQNPGWVGRYLANEMYTCKPENIFRGGHAHYVLTVDASSQGDYILSGGADDTVYLWDASSNQKIYRHVFDDMVKCVRISNDQKQFAVADRSNVVSLFDTSSGDLVHKFGPFEQDVSSICFHPSEPILVCGHFGNDSSRSINATSREYKFEDSQPADLVFVNTDTAEVLQSNNVHAEEITSVTFDASGRRLVTSCLDGKLRVWKLAKPDDPDSKIRYELERTIIAHPGGANDADVSRDGTLIASCGNDKTASIWNAETGELVMNFAGHSRGVLGVAISPAGDLIATGSNDETAIIWDLAGNKVATWRGHAGPINEVCFTANGEQIITAADDKTLRRWNTEPAGTSVTYNFSTPQAVWPVWQADFSPDKRTVAAASEEGAVFLIGSRDGKLKRTLEHGQPVTSLTWLNDGRLLTAGEDLGLKVWDRLDRTEEIIEPERTIELQESTIWEISTSPDEDRIVIASSDKTARVLDSKTFGELGVLCGHVEGLASAKFSPDGKQIATACDDGSIGIWDANNYELLFFLNEHKHSVWRVAFSPVDSNLLASCASNGRILLWDLETRRSHPVVFPGHQEQVAGLTFTPNGKSLVSASDDGTVRFWDVETGVELFVIQNKMAPVMIHASFSDDGQSLVTCGVGVVDVRHASKKFVSPYLPSDAVADAIDKEELVFDEVASPDELEEIVTVAQKIVDNYPSWDGFGILGIAQCRLGRHAEAVKSLEEGWRLKKILHGSDNTSKPLGLGYFVIALVEVGERERAREMKDLFDRTVEEYWYEDAEIQQLQNRVNDAILD